MATEVLDPKTFGSWEDAFKYPIPAVRRMEVQLRNDINANREKLRTLVGASYRDLLGTAETIIHMDGEMQTVEDIVGSISRRCNTRLVERNATVLKKLGSRHEAADKERFTVASQLAVLRSCPEVLSRLLRRGGSVLLAAKVLVIARLLHKKLAQNQHTASYVETIRLRLAKLRSRLLTVIDRRLGNEATQEVLLDSMCAYSLATSSSSTDILRHFLRTRLHVIANTEVELNWVSDTTKDEPILISLRLWIRTVQDVRALFPRFLSLALAKLKATALIKGDDLRAITEFDLDIHEMWIGDEIRNFTPYIQHDDLQNSVTTKMLNSWSPTSLDTLLTLISARLAVVGRVEYIITLRKDCIDLWLSSAGAARGVDFSDMLEKLRTAFSARLVGLINTECEKLFFLENMIGHALKGQSFTLTSHKDCLWAMTSAPTTSGRGSEKYLQDLQDTFYSRNALVSNCLKEHITWTESMNELQEMIEKLKETKWTTDNDDLDDDFETGKSFQTLLSQTDPEELKTQLSASISSSFTKLGDSICKLIAGMPPNDGQTGAKSAFLLRVLRDITHHLPLGHETPEFAAAATKTLHASVASHVVGDIISRNQKLLRKAVRARAVPPQRALWQGTPELPVLPSPWTFTFLRAVEEAMADVGADIWNGAAVGQVKRKLRASLMEQFEKEAEKGVGAATHGADATGSRAGSGVPDKDARIQRLFDLRCLSVASSVAGSGGDGFEAYIASLAAEPDMGEEVISRLGKSAEEYWRKTSLLFGLLAQPSP
jgi:hypothetical protein